MIKAGGISFGGMNQDMSAQDPRRNQFYYEAQNITLIFNGELSQNVIKNETGNRLLVSLPNIALANSTGSTNPIWKSNPDDDLLFTEDTTLTSLPTGAQGRILTHPTLSNFNSIIGDIGNTTIQHSYYGTEFDEYYNGSTTSILGTSQVILGGSFIKDSLVVISMSESNVSGNGHLCVWEISYDNEYNTTTYLKFFGPYANMDKSYPVTKIETFYESDLIQKVYWTDARNQLRTVNIKHNLPFFRATTVIDSSPEIDLSPIKITQSINGGGNWAQGAGMVQYGYRLYTKNGPTTKLSPLSGIAPIVKDLHGVPRGEAGDILFKVAIDGVDSSFEWIEVYRFRIDDSGAVVAYLIHEAEIGPRESTTESVNILLFDKGDSSVIRIQSDLAALRFGVSGPYIPRTFEIKDNRIFLGNIEETVFNVDYDTRAYSFTSNAEAGFTEAGSQISKLRSAEGGFEHTIDGTASTIEWPTKTNLDAINKSVLALPDADHFERYQYKANGTTQGGQGPNVSFTFDFDDEPHSTYFKYPQFYSKGAYKLGEPYRFGVQFFDKYGNGSFVNWIADVRMPELKRIGTSVLYSAATNKFKLAYPKFTLSNLATLPDDIHSFRIVRAIKDSSDRLLLSQGYLNHTFWSNSGESSNSVRTNYHDSKHMPYYGLGYYNGATKSKGGCLTTPGDIYHISDADISEAFTGGVGRYKRKSFYLALYLPEITYGLSTIEPSTNNTMRVVAGSAWAANTAGTSTVRSQGYSYEKVSGVDEAEYLTLDNWRDVYDPPDNVGVVSARISPWHNSDLARAGIATNHKFTWHRANEYHTTPVAVGTRNTAAGFNGYTSISTMVQTTAMGTPIGSDVINLQGGNDYINHTVLWCTLDPNGGFADNERHGIVGKGPNSYIFSTGDVLGASNKWFDPAKAEFIFYEDDYPSYPVIEYINPSTNPYGGNSYENRQTTKYIPCTDLITIGSQSSINAVAYGGDTFPQLYNALLLDYNEDTTTAYNANLEPWHGANGGSTAGLTLVPLTSDLHSTKVYMSLPVETYCNLYHANGKTNESVHKVPKSTYADIPEYNQVYNRESTYEVAFPKAAKFTGVQNFNTMTRYSDVKIMNQNIDNLCIFRPNNFNNVDSQLGAISAFHIFGDNLYVIQERGVGIWLVNPNAIAATSTGPTSLGTGGVLHDYRVISSEYGSTYSFGSIVGSRAVYILDMNKRKFLAITNNTNSISDVNGLHAKLIDLQKTITDDMYGNGTGVRLHYDPITFNVYVSIYYDDSDTGNVIDVSEPLPS